MLQAIEQLQLLGLLVIVAGIILIVAGMMLSTRSTSEDQQVQHESKGVVFIGPIPLVWGFGRRGWYVAGAIAVILLLLYILMVI